jgi:hypothetical protein
MNESNKLEQIKNKQIYKAITVDTSVFGDKNKYNLYAPILSSLKYLSESGINVIFSKIIIEEIRSHLKENVTTFINNVRKEINSHHYIKKAFKNEIDMLNCKIDKSESLIDDIIDTFIKEKGIDVLPLDKYLNADILFDKYFKTEPPFGNKKEKKHEFPDAVALISLDKWAVEKGYNMIVVSNDGGWVDYCADKQHLKSVKNIAEANDFLLSNETNIVNLIMSEIRKSDSQGIMKDIKESLKLEIKDNSFYTEARNSRFDIDIDIRSAHFISIPDYQDRQFLYFQYKNEKILRLVYEESVLVNFNTVVDVYSSDDDGNNISVYQFDEDVETTISVDVILVFDIKDGTFVFREIESVEIDNYVSIYDEYEVDFENY